MTIAVVGASGFIGQHVLHALVRRGVPDIVATSRSGHGPDLPGVRWMRYDLADSTKEVMTTLGRPEQVVHLAWSGLPNYSSLHHFETELPRQYAFLRCLVDDGLQSLLVAGTCYEYGMLTGELHEQQGSAPSNPYGHAKLALLRQLEFLKSSVSFELTWARLFYSYGEWQAPSSLYSLLKAAVHRGDAVFPMSAGEQLRDFLPAAILGEMIAALALFGKGVGTVNVCSGVPISVRSLVEGWLRENGWSIRLDFGRYPYPAHEPLAFWGSRKKLDALFAAKGESWPTNVAS